MSRAPKHRVVETLLERHGRTYADEAGIRLRDTPAPLFQLLVLSLLLSARIRASVAVAALRALSASGWTTAEKLADARWEERTRVLNRSGYARYDERTSTMLGQTSDLALRRYGGDLRRLREDADRDPDAERRALQRFSGIGEVGAAIFSREAQLIWDELFPFADRRALRAAQRIGLGDDVASLERSTDDREQFTTLVAALVRCDIAGDHDEVLRAARERHG
jgi:endonuclease III